METHGESFYFHFFLFFQFFFMILSYTLIYPYRSFTN